MPKLGNVLKTVVGKKEGRLDRVNRITFGSQLLCAPTIFKTAEGTRIIVPTGSGELHCLDELFNVLWTYKIKEEVSAVQQMFLDEEKSQSIHAPVSIMYHQGSPQRIVFGADSGSLYSIDMKGNLAWKFPTKGVIRTQPLLADINGDGLTEILFGSTDSKFYVLDANGNLLWDFEAESGITSSPQIMETSKDRNLIVFGGGDGNIYALNVKGDVIWKYDTYGKVVAAPSIGKIYGNNNNFVLVGSYDGELYAIDEYGALRWRFKTDGSIFTKPILADLNKDGKLEVVFGSCDDNLYFLSASGSRIWKYETDFWIVADPLIVDIDNDGTPEIIAGSYDHNIYVLDPGGKYALDFVPGVSIASNQMGHYGEEMTQTPGEFKGSRIWQYKSDDLIVGLGSFVAQDGTASVLACIKNGKVDVFKHVK